MANNRALVNGVGYSWVDISVNILGRTLEGIVSLNSAYSRLKENTKGRGKKAVERVRGSEDFVCSMGVTKKESAAIQNSLPPGTKLTDIKPFPIIITTVNDENLPIVESWVMCEFTGKTSNYESSQLGLVDELELIVGDIITT